MNKKDFTILLIDDDEMVLKSLEMTFISNGFKILTANDGNTGLIIALDKKPDLIITDIEMKETDGMVLFDKVREQGQWGKKVPIILLTNFEASQMIIKHIVNNQPAIHLFKSKVSPRQILEKTIELLS